MPLPVTNTPLNNNNSSLNQGGGRSTNNKTATSTLVKGRTPPLSLPSPEIVIKIEDDDNRKRLEEEEEEVELWNDEDGLVVDEDFDALDSLLPPANKRQRTISPSPATTTTSHGTAPDPNGKVQLVNNAQHLIGSEVNKLSYLSYITSFSCNSITHLFDMSSFLLPT